MFVPSQPAATKYQFVVLAKAVVAKTIESVDPDPSRLTLNLGLREAGSRYTSHSASFGETLMLYLPSNPASFPYVIVAVLAQNVVKK